MQPLPENSERRDHARLTHVSAISIKEMKDGKTHSARMFNYSGTGIYFESDSLIAAETDIYLGIHKTPYEKGESDYDCYRARIKWRKDLSEESAYFYGYGVEFSSEPPIIGNSDSARPTRNKRKYPRKTFRKAVKFGDEKGIFKGMTADISPAGVFVQSSNDYRSGQLVSLALPDKDGKNVLIRGKVVWSNKTGFGLKFIQKARGRVG